MFLSFLKLCFPSSQIDVFHCYFVCNQVDQNNLSALDQEEDVHVLTGALKLFFRELKEPLIPYTAFSKAIKASSKFNY